jgi:predicted nucleic acid-binding protein
LKAVLDTNILVSGLLTEAGPCARLLDLANEGGFQTVYNEEILGEYERVLLRPEFGFEPQAVALLVSRFRRKGIRSTRPFPPAGLPDAHDEVFLEAARGVENTWLVSGNLRHFPQAKCRGVKTASPRRFLEILGATNP